MRSLQEQRKQCRCASPENGEKTGNCDGESGDDLAHRAANEPRYSKKTAESIGHENLRKPKIAAAVAERQAARAERVQMDQDWILRRLRENILRAMQHEPVLDAKGESTGTYTYQGSVANRALELLGKHLGMFVERKIIGLKRLEDMDDAELRYVLGELEEEIGVFETPSRTEQVF